MFARLEVIKAVLYKIQEFKDLRHFGW